MKILVVGAGGREHCLAWKISQSALVDKIYCAPGNGGTALCAENVSIKASDIEGLLQFALDKKVDLTVVGPEAALVDGIVDRFQEKNLKIFGPDKKLAMLEGSKVFAKEAMRKYGIPTAGFKSFSDPAAAGDYVKSKHCPLVIKADGLAAGKGVIICRGRQEALVAIDMVMLDRVFGRAGDRVVVEDFLEGEEASILAFTDGDTVIPLVSSQDHKRIFDADQGPNTGGMGAYAPAPAVTPQVWTKIISQIFTPLIKGLKNDGLVYKGILYAGIMIKDGQPYVLEFNVRFGDPETQVVLPKLKSDLVEVMLKTVSSGLKNSELEWDERVCLCVVAASGGYPGDFEKGREIKGLDAAVEVEDVWVFHAGTKIVHSPQSIVYRKEEKEKCAFITDGGRVLSVAALGNTVADAQDKAYKAIEKISFEGMYYRKDIGYRA